MRGVTVVEDPHHPRGFRELCSPAELKRRKDNMIRAGQTTCFYGGEQFENYNDIVVAHKEPKGMDGARRDDHISNLTLSCSRHNLENGSKRIYQPTEGAA